MLRANKVDPKHDDIRTWIIGGILFVILLFSVDPVVSFYDQHFSQTYNDNVSHETGGEE